MENKKDNLKSNCCNAEVKIESGVGDFIGDKTSCTIYYICTKCKEACDVHINKRKVWIRNPKTQIIPNKKSIKLTSKELEEIHKNEDF